MVHLLRCEWAHLRCWGSLYPSKGLSATTGVESYRLLSYHRVTADGILVRPPSVLVSYPEPVLHSQKQNTESAQSTNALPMLLGNIKETGGNRSRRALGVCRFGHMYGGAGCVADLRF